MLDCSLVQFLIAKQTNTIMAHSTNHLNLKPPHYRHKSPNDPRDKELSIDTTMTHSSIPNTILTYHTHSAQTELTQNTHPISLTNVDSQSPTSSNTNTNTEERVFIAPPQHTDTVWKTLSHGLSGQQFYDRVTAYHNIMVRISGYLAGFSFIAIEEEPESLEYGSFMRELYGIVGVVGFSSACAAFMLSLMLYAALTLLGPEGARFFGGIYLFPTFPQVAPCQNLFILFFVNLIHQNGQIS